jgi:hypothetical protein
MIQEPLVQASGGAAAGNDNDTRQKLLVFSLVSLLTLADQLIRSAVLPPYLIHLTCNELKADSCDDKYVVDKARAKLELATSLANAAAFLSVGALCALADCPSIGRRRIYLLVMTSMAVNNACWTFVPVVSIELLLGLQVATSVLGNNYTCLALGFTMVADLSHRDQLKGKESKREFAFTLMEGLLYMGILAGPFLGGLTVKLLGYRAGFGLALAVEIICIALAFFFLEETMPVNKKKIAEAQGSDNTCSRLRWLLLSPTRFLGFFLARPARSIPTTGITRWLRVWIALALVFEWVGRRGFEFILPLYTKQEFGWGSYQLGILSVLIGGAGMVSNVGLVRALGNQKEVPSKADGAAVATRSSGAGMHTRACYSRGCGLSGPVIAACAGYSIAAGMVCYFCSGLMVGGGRSGGDNVSADSGSGRPPALFYVGSTLYGLGCAVSPLLRGILSRTGTVHYTLSSILCTNIIEDSTA